MNLPQSGFPRGFSAATLFTTVLLLSTLAGAQQLTAAPSPLHFGKVVTGQTTTLNVTLTNNASTSVTVNSVTNAPPFSVSSPSLPFTLVAGQSTQVGITFAPIALGITLHTIAFSTTASSSPLNVAVRGEGVTEWALTANPLTLAFGNVQTGSSVTLPVALTNSGTAAITISQGGAKGAGFSLSGLALPLLLAPGESYTFSASFSPQSAGPVSGTVWVSNPKNTVVRVALTGMGTAAGQLAITPANMNFGSVVDGGSASQSATLTATGASVTISSAKSSNSEFSLSGLALPVTLAAGQNASFTVAFSPQGTGAAAANLAFSSNASSGATATLAGTGIAPYSVSLSWDGSTSPVTCYNVYRSANTGGPYSKIYALDPNTSYTDNSVAGGNTYYYVTTAVNSTGQESAYSNQVTAVIP